ncbi:hypothetical protein C9374_011547 [Naegleria lovaniensis]|uniref:Protein kinase domain-containing protein n=1 Tax=Naegleria lovaniensis TaxID=51637 RepID=A0AA88H4G8_NAELO|nr:uncharacterized protein C9374_011547 [Naegleria lovaniensis]KAG2392822.1 hypothetical protein C9374_011547 [Naegleria lovaniensis]
MQAVRREDNSLERASDDLKKDLEILRNAVKQRSVELALKNKEYILQNMNDMISIEIRNNQQIMNEIYTMIDKFIQQSSIQESENIEQHNNEIINQLHFHQQDDPFPSSNFEGIFQEFDTNDVTSSDMMSTLNSLLIQDRDDDLFPSSSFEGMIEDIIHQHTNTTSTIHSHTPTLDFSFIYQILQQQGYTNIQYLTSCGFGHVYKACINDQSVALKMILWPPTDTAGLQRALIEAMNMARLFHPNVVQVRSAKPLRQVSAMFIEMELMKGSFNSLMISKEIRVSEKMLIEIMRQVCGVLVWMQQHNIVPIDNILIKELDLENEEIHIAISDFGLAKASDHTNNSSLAGTYLFLAPELENEFLLPESRTSRFSVASDIRCGVHVTFKPITKTFPSTNHASAEINEFI